MVNSSVVVDSHESLQFRLLQSQGCLKFRTQALMQIQMAGHHRFIRFGVQQIAQGRQHVAFVFKFINIAASRALVFST